MDSGALMRALCELRPLIKLLKYCCTGYLSEGLVRRGLRARGLTDPPCLWRLIAVPLMVQRAV